MARTEGNIGAVTKVERGPTPNGHPASRGCLLQLLMHDLSTISRVNRLSATLRKMSAKPSGAAPTLVRYPVRAAPWPVGGRPEASPRLPCLAGLFLGWNSYRPHCIINPDAYLPALSSVRGGR